MEPAFHRGDLLFLTNFEEEPVRTGDIVVFKIEGREIPIVHRVLTVHEKYVSVYDHLKYLLSFACRGRFCYLKHTLLCICLVAGKTVLPNS